MTKPAIEIPKILDAAAGLVDEKIIAHEAAADGADHVVCKIRLQSGAWLVVKAGPDADTDAYVLKKLLGSGVKAPGFINRSEINQHGNTYPLVVMTCFRGSLLKDLPAGQRPDLITEVIKELNKVHNIKSPDGAGYVLDVASSKGTSWQQFLLGILTGKDPLFNWDKVLADKRVDSSLAKRALLQTQDKVKKLPEVPPALLHGDINGANIFVKNGRLEGIIDWSEAKFGDPLLDFARLRMNIRSRMDPETLKIYHDTLHLTPDESAREKTYYQLLVLEYLNWYLNYNWTDMIHFQQQLLKETLKA